MILLKNFITLSLYTGLLLLTVSCISLNLEESYTNLGKRYDIDLIPSPFTCDYIYVYTDIRTNKKLNGYFKLKEQLDRRFVYASFLGGKYHGEYRIYQRGKLKEISSYSYGIKNGKEIKYTEMHDFDNEKDKKYTIISNYDNGKLDGIREIYRKGKLIQKTSYKNKIKNGKEYNFNLQGDTLNIIDYTLDINVWQPSLKGRYMNEQDKYFFDQKYKFKFIGKITITIENKMEVYNEFFWEDEIISYSNNCEENLSCLIEYSNKEFMVYYYGRGFYYTYEL